MLFNLNGFVGVSTLRYEPNCLVLVMNDCFGVVVKRAVIDCLFALVGLLQYYKNTI